LHICCCSRYCSVTIAVCWRSMHSAANRLVPANLASWYAVLSLLLRS
jgi:hypothetical protein